MANGSNASFPTDGQATHRCAVHAGNQIHKHGNRQGQTSATNRTLNYVGLNAAFTAAAVWEGFMLGV
jgi:hypothetical protein